MKAALAKLHEDAQHELYENILQFYVTAYQYLVKKLPCLHDELYKHCKVAYVHLCVSSKFSSVIYFVDRHKWLLEIQRINDTVSMDQLEKEFTQYQTAVDLPQTYRADVQWHMISDIKDTLGNFKYR